MARPAITTGRQPIPICQAASGSGGTASGKCFVSTVPSPSQQETRQLSNAGFDAVAADQDEDPAKRHHQRQRADQR
jgi:hypothetical protein